ncbi:hypothetical protein [Polymorphobacter fuscus]|uniref:Methyltransferase type 11 n=1 Tax=Sandarakinorhabdus fusca TaxID=1439888 RepID=A0A7C9KKB2_9SPHN|nr:hypothetical protein [Polymorphobacter fuscus]KAB7644152.1 hypothetical protein F9290_14900 [Polymorphobacter fuscus]MQT18541.1 hypothetical protein [Polymorphobacter fuscus]NJC08336.1 hypothetical protein [Polymorphobacter fuscus]
MTPARPKEDDAPLARLLSGGAHNRLLILGDPPAGLALGDTSPFDQVGRILLPDQASTAFAGLPHAVAAPRCLPFVEALFDRLLVTTPLPAADARAELRELWRILCPAALIVFVVKARRPWQLASPGWLEDDLRSQLEDAMFEPLDWRIETIPDRHHLILAGKTDGLRPAPIGTAQITQTATA